MENYPLKAIAYDVANGISIKEVAKKHNYSYCKLMSAIKRHDLRRFRVRETRFNEVNRLKTAMANFEKGSGIKDLSTYQPKQVYIPNNIKL